MTGPTLGSLADGMTVICFFFCESTKPPYTQYHQTSSSTKIKLMYLFFISLSLFVVVIVVTAVIAYTVLNGTCSLVN